MRPAVNPTPAGYGTAALRTDVCAPGTGPSPCRLQNSRRPEGRVCARQRTQPLPATEQPPSGGTREHPAGTHCLPQGLPDHRARANRRGECSVIANHTPNGTTPNTTRNDTRSPPPYTPTRHHTTKAHHQGRQPTPRPPSSPATTTTTTQPTPARPHPPPAGHTRQRTHHSRPHRHQSRQRRHYP